MAQYIRTNIELVRMIDAGEIKVIVDDTTLIQSENPLGYWESNVSISEYQPVRIEIHNLKQEEVFDYETTLFEYESYQSGRILTINIEPDIKEPDKMVWDLETASEEEWRQLISNNQNNWETPLSNKKNLKIPSVLNIDLRFKVRPTPPTKDYPFIKIYDVSMDNIEKLNDELREKNKELEKPLTNYISSLYRIPYPLESEGDEVNIQIGSVGFESKGNLVSPYTQRFNLGSIDLRDAEIGGTGYKDVGIMLYVPNFKPIELDTGTVINKIIDIILIVDITTGKGTLNIEVNGDVQYIETDYIGKDIPFKADDININIGSSIIETTFDRPYIIVNSLEPENSITTDKIQQKNFATWEYSLIKVDNVMLNTKATKSEQAEINRLLSKGVYVRK